MSNILHINKSESHCECSGRTVNPRLSECPHCGIMWDTVTSDYVGAGIEKAVMRLRPDLEPYFPWSDWWESQEGQRQLDELRTILQMDENQNEQE